MPSCTAHVRFQGYSGHAVLHCICGCSVEANIEAHITRGTSSDDLSETSNAHRFMFGNTFVITLGEHRNRAG
jgi:hypothetical protein